MLSGLVFRSLALVVRWSNCNKHGRGSGGNWQPFTLFVVGDGQRSQSTKHTSDLGRPDGRMDGATWMAETIMAAAVENLLVTDGKEGRERRGSHT